MKCIKEGKCKEMPCKQQTEREDERVRVTEMHCTGKKKNWRKSLKTYKHIIIIIIRLF